MDRLQQLREIEAKYTPGEMLTFLKVFAGACSQAVKEDWSWTACIDAGHLGVKEFGPDVHTKIGG